MEGKGLTIIREKKEEQWEKISWYLAKRVCAGCKGDIEYLRTGYGLVCDACQEDIGSRSAYKCIKGCAFALCASCAECKSRHLLDRAKGMPPKYTAKR